jgi:hypothetical protein
MYRKFKCQYFRIFVTLFIILPYLVSALPAEAGHEFGKPLLPSMEGSSMVMFSPQRKINLLYTESDNTYPSANDLGLRQSIEGYPWGGPPEDSPNWRGIKVDTFYFVALQFAAVALLYVMPEKISGWSQEDKDNYSFSKWTENVRNPIWDDDEWYVNYILHPYWGATYYIRGRERGLKRSYSFWYSFLLSALYEYGAEALFEPVSYQDLIVTPVAGALIGEYLFTPIREHIRAKGNLRWTDKAVLVMTDPLGVVSEELSQFFGINTQVSFHLIKTSQIEPLNENSRSVKIKSSDSINSSWGIRLKIDL